MSSCLMLMQYRNAIAELQEMIEEIPVEPRPKNKVNQVQKKN